MLEAFAAYSQNRVRRMHPDFFQRLQAIANRFGAHHINLFDARFGHRNARGPGVGLQPLGMPRIQKNTAVRAAVPWDLDGF